MTDIELLNDIKIKLNEIGVRAGDTVYVASDITGLLYLAKTECDVKIKQRDEFLNKFVNTLQEMVGPEGTLLFPAFSWDFCRGNGFDIRSTKGEVGALNNWILKNREDFIRTKHPMYSFLVWGKYAHRLAAMNNQDAWGDAGPFTFLRDNHGKQLFFDIQAHQGITFGHYVEQCVDVPYRHPKYFFGSYTDKNGVTETRCYCMYVRDLNVMQEISITNEWLIENGVAAGTESHGLTLTYCDLAKAYPLLYNDMKNNNGANTLSFENYELDWSKEKTIPFELGGLA
ncbi:MAG: AAC(3) family N-acetyltransferase [Pseudobutyrivibrio sp.]|nr:AAC(3) family N-acetyltransferase [Pseudobutyrivibrio sp.]